MRRAAVVGRRTCLVPSCSPEQRVATHVVAVSFVGVSGLYASFSLAPAPPGPTWGDSDGDREIPDILLDRDTLGKLASTGDGDCSRVSLDDPPSSCLSRPLLPSHSILCTAPASVWLS